MANTREKLIKLLERSYFSSDESLAECLIANGVGFLPKWIPVTEMMPESHVEPIEYIDGTHYSVISDFVLGYTDKGQILCVQHEVGDERDWWITYDCSYHTVTHWMPLPEAPKGE